jgi:N-acetyl-gamma-glutamyl-phosphate reductase
MTSDTRRLRIAILGGSGYTGGELLRLLVRHPSADIVLLTADRRAGEPVATVFPHLGAQQLPDFVSLDEVEWAGIDVDIVFCALPHGTTHAVAKGLLHSERRSVVDGLIVETRQDLIAAVPSDVKIIDLSPDFRLDDTDLYAEWYGTSHDAAALQPRAVYGLSEFARGDIATTNLVACPGCYPTASLLPLVPLLEAGLIDHDDIIIDAKSGVTGAGRGAKEANLFAEVSEGIHAYGVAGHRHLPEIEQELGKAAGGSIKVSFTPHLMPMNRGILSTIYVKLATDADAATLRDALTSRFDDEPFVYVVPEGVAPATRHVRGSNNCLIGVFEGRLPGRAVILSVIDNLVKGASGQAVQNMNIAGGLPETTALEQAPLFP